MNIRMKRKVVLNESNHFEVELEDKLVTPLAQKEASMMQEIIDHVLREQIIRHLMHTTGMTEDEARERVMRYYLP